jgi:hypothetical protein
MSWAWLTRKKNDSPGEMNKMETEYVPARYFRQFMTAEMQERSPGVFSEAKKVEMAGRKAYTQSKNLLASYVMYLGAYKRDGSPTNDEEVLRVFTNRVLEDLLLYLVYNYQKNKMKASFMQIPGIPLPSQPEEAQSLAITYSSSGLTTRPINFFTPEFIQALNEIVMANPEKAREYKLQPGTIAGSSSTLPTIFDRERRGDAAVNEAIQLADTILAKRYEVYTGLAGERGVSVLDLQRRIREGVMQGGPPPAAAPAATAAANVASTTRMVSSFLPSIFTGLPMSSGPPVGMATKRGRNNGANNSLTQGNNKRQGLVGPDGNPVQAAPPPAEHLDEEEGEGERVADDAQDSQEGQQLLQVVFAPAPPPANGSQAQQGGRRKSRRSRRRMNKKKRKTRRR